MKFKRNMMLSLAVRFKEQMEQARRRRLGGDSSNRSGKQDLGAESGNGLDSSSQMFPTLRTTAHEILVLVVEKETSPRPVLHFLDASTGGMQEKMGQPSIRSALTWIPALSSGLD